MNDENIIKVINAFYKGAGIRKKFRGPVNERVARIFGIMLTEAKKCSSSLSWIPTPTGGKATISWILRNFGKGMINRLKGSQYLTCAKAVIYKWARELDRAAILG